MEISVLGKIILGLIILFVLIGIILFITTGGIDILEILISAFRFG
jgi:hypothetical protein